MIREAFVFRIRSENDIFDQVIERKSVITRKRIVDYCFSVPLACSMLGELNSMQEKRL